MNQRIKELIEQATETTTVHWQGLDARTMSREERKFNQEKFAQLIVRECIGIAYEYDEPKLSGPGMIIGNRIEEHFGIE